MYDRHGKRVLQVCPHCRLDWHKAAPACRSCGTPLPPPWTPVEPIHSDRIDSSSGSSTVYAEADEVPAYEPADEPDPEQEAHESPRGSAALFRWVWLAAGLNQVRRTEARVEAAGRREVATLREMVVQLVRELP